MPRQVDAKRRRDEIAAAALRVVARDGIAAASVRSVAAEAGLSVGSLRHFLPTQRVLLQIAFEASWQRLAERMERIPDQPTMREQLIEGSLAGMPIDAASREENRVFLSFLAQASVDHDLAELADRYFDDASQLARAAIEALVAAGEAREDLDVELAAMTLHTLLDGLALLGAQDPSRCSPEQMRRTLEACINSFSSGLSHK